MPQNNLISPNPDPRALMLASIGELPGLAEDPYFGTCSRCIHEGDKKPCPIMGRKMLAMDSCDSFSDAPILDFNMVSSSLRSS